MKVEKAFITGNPNTTILTFLGIHIEIRKHVARQVWFDVLEFSFGIFSILWATILSYYHLTLTSISLQIVVIP